MTKQLMTGSRMTRTRSPKLKRNLKRKNKPRGRVGARRDTNTNVRTWRTTTRRRRPNWCWKNILESQKARPSLAGVEVVEALPNRFKMIRRSMNRKKHLCDASKSELHHESELEGISQASRGRSIPPKMIVLITAWLWSKRW